ncbi:MAG: hypothetical protein WBV96_05230, partial [Polyangia bacterium]
MSGHISFASHSSPDHHEARARAVAHGFLPATVFALLALAGNGLAGCVKSEVVSTEGANGGATGGAAGQGTSGAGGTIQLAIDTTSTVTPSSVDTGVTSQMVGCDGGDGCTCPPLNVAVLGKPGKWGANPNGDPDTALQDWLNSSSAGTARVDNFTNRVTLTSDFLATYNVIILASLSDDSNLGPFWTFDPSEVAAFQDWVENKGGGVITLTGYSGNGQEINAPNQLIAFSGISYNNDGINAPYSWPVSGCAGSNPISDWIKTDPVIASLSNNVTWIGLANGRSINAPADGHVAATVPGPPIANVLVGKLVGTGHVLVYGDEWITYTTQWNGVGNPETNDPACAGFLPQDVYQTAQFWYNMIKWSQPSAACFEIVDEQ